MVEPRVLKGHQRHRELVILLASIQTALVYFEQRSGPGQGQPQLLRLEGLVAMRDWIVQDFLVLLHWFAVRKLVHGPPRIVLLLDERTLLRLLLLREALGPLLGVRLEWIIPSR